MRCSLRSARFLWILVKTALLYLTMKSSCGSVSTAESKASFPDLENDLSVEATKIENKQYGDYSAGDNFKSVLEDGKEKHLDLAAVLTTKDFSQSVVRSKPIEFQVYIVAAQSQQHPSQTQTITIPSRRLKEEWYRLLTFLKLSLPHEFSSIRLARDGFFYSGDSPGDSRIKCYFCAIEINLAATTDVQDVHENNKPFCPMVQKLAPENVKIRVLVNATFESVWNNLREMEDPEDRKSIIGIERGYEYPPYNAMSPRDVPTTRGGAKAYTIPQPGARQTLGDIDYLAQRLELRFRPGIRSWDHSNRSGYEIDVSVANEIFIPDATTRGSSNAQDTANSVPSKNPMEDDNAQGTANSVPSKIPMEDDNVQDTAYLVPSENTIGDDSVHDAANLVSSENTNMMAPNRSDSDNQPLSPGELCRLCNIHIASIVDRLCGHVMIACNACSSVQRECLVCGETNTDGSSNANVLRE